MPELQGKRLVSAIQRHGNFVYLLEAVMAPDSCRPVVTAVCDPSAAVVTEAMPPARNASVSAAVPERLQERGVTM